MCDNILFFDGTCGFCDKVINLANKWQKTSCIKFASLEGKTAGEFREKYKDFPESLDAIVFYSNGQFYVAHLAFFKLSTFFKRPYVWLKYLRYFPDIISRTAYKIIAKNRYYFFGKLDACDIPDDNIRRKILP